MNIDLLFTQDGEAGLLASQNFFKKLACVVLDFETSTLTLEYKDMDYLELNIPVEQDYFAVLDASPLIHIGAVMKGDISQAYQVPLMIMDDPYRLEMFKDVGQGESSLQAFGYFVKSCMFGQPVHRDDLGDENTQGCILGDAMPSSLQFAPHLARQIALEAGLRAAPRAAPRGPSGPGMGGGGGGSTSQAGYYSSGSSLSTGSGSGGYSSSSKRFGSQQQGKGKKPPKSKDSD